MQKLILVNKSTASSDVMMTSTVRDLQTSYPNKYAIEIVTTFPAIWKNNPNIIKVSSKNI